METIDIEQVRSALNGQSGTPVVNVLSAEDYQREHIPGSLSVPLESDDFVERVGRQVTDRTHPVIVHCASSQCDASERAARKLEENGFEHVRDFPGGIARWREAGYKLESQQNHASSREH